MSSSRPHIANETDVRASQSSLEEHSANSLNKTFAMQSHVSRGSQALDNSESAMPVQSHLQRSDSYSSYLTEVSSMTTLVPDTVSTADNYSLDSRARLIRSGSGSSSSTSTIRGVSASDSHHRSTAQTQWRRATVSDIHDTTNSGHASKPKKTAGRQTFVALCKVTNLFIPLDYDQNKTSMRESGIGRLVLRHEDATADQPNNSWQQDRARRSVG